jgi:hypothetical protein
VKVRIEARDQEEFDSKRAALIEKLAGKPALSPRPPRLKAEGEMFAHWDARFQAMMAAIKKDISEVLDAALHH